MLQYINDAFQTFYMIYYLIYLCSLTCTWWNRRLPFSMFITPCVFVLFIIIKCISLDAFIRQKGLVQGICSIYKCVVHSVWWGAMPL